MWYPTFKEAMAEIGASSGTCYCDAPGLATFCSAKQSIRQVEETMRRSVDRWLVVSAMFFVAVVIANDVVVSSAKGLHYQYATGCRQSRFAFASIRYDTLCEQSHT
jgi:hypothetical protein